MEFGKNNLILYFELKRKLLFKKISTNILLLFLSILFVLSSISHKTKKSFFRYFENFSYFFIQMYLVGFCTSFWTGKTHILKNLFSFKTHIFYMSLALIKTLIQSP
jgi:hypothetical protein